MDAHIGDEIVIETHHTGVPERKCVIIDIRGQDDKAEATIRFRDAGTKHLSLAWAPLKKLSR